MGIELAQKTKGDLVIATDPDCDRMGVAVRTAQPRRLHHRRREDELLTGNQIGSLMAYYRAHKFSSLEFEQGECFPRRDHQDIRYDRSAKGRSRNMLWLALRRDADWIQIYRVKNSQKTKRQFRKTYETIMSILAKDRRKLRSSFVLLCFRGEESYGYSGPTSSGTRTERFRHHVLRSRRLRQLEKPNGRRITRRNLCPPWLFRGKKTVPSFRGGRRAPTKSRAWSTHIPPIRRRRCLARK